MSPAKTKQIAAFLSGKMRAQLLAFIDECASWIIRETMRFAQKRRNELEQNRAEQNKDGQENGC